MFEVTLSTGVAVELDTLVESPPLILRGSGGAFLAGLACAEPGQIGYGMPACVVDGTAAELRTFLGMGATASGFAAMWWGDPVFVKIMRPSPDSAAVDTEENVLRALGTAPGIVKLVAREGPLFLLKPLGAVSYSISAPGIPSRVPETVDGALWAAHTSDSRPSDLDSPLAEVVLPMAADFCALVDALTLMHQAGFIHRDPRPANFFRTATREFFSRRLGLRGGNRQHGWRNAPVRLHLRPCCSACCPCNEHAAARCAARARHGAGGAARVCCVRT